MAIDYANLDAGGTVTLWLNVGLHALLLLLACYLTLLRFCSRRSRRSRQVAHSLLLLYAVGRVVWASFIVVYAPSFAKPNSLARIACLLDAACECVFFSLAALLLTQVADAISIGWKSRRCIWRCFYLVIGLVPLYLAGLVLASDAYKRNSSIIAHVQYFVYAAASSLVALLLCAIGRRYARMETPLVLRTFVLARRAMKAVALVCIGCFLIRACPLEYLIWFSRGRPGCGAAGEHSCVATWDVPVWVNLLHSHWIAELVPAVGMLLLIRALEKLKLGAYRSASMCSISGPLLLPPAGVPEEAGRSEFGGEAVSSGRGRSDGVGRGAGGREHAPLDSLTAASLPRVFPQAPA